MFKTELICRIGDSVELSNNYSFKYPLGMVFPAFALLCVTKMFFFAGRVMTNAPLVLGEALLKWFRAEGEKAAGRKLLTLAGNLPRRSGLMRSIPISKTHRRII